MVPVDAELSVGAGSVLDMAPTLAELLKTVPGVAVGSTRTTTLNVCSSPVGNTASAQLIVPVPPTAGVDLSGWDLTVFESCHQLSLQGGPGQEEIENLRLEDGTVTSPIGYHNVGDAIVRNAAQGSQGGGLQLCRVLWRQQLRQQLQIRIEAINALNYTVLWNPDQNPRNSTFAIVNQDRNNPRDIQLGGRVTF